MGSYAGKLTLKGGDRAIGSPYWTTGVVPPGSPADHDSISILGGSGAGYGGGVAIVAGNDGGAEFGSGGYVTIAAGMATHAGNSYGGKVNITTANHTSTYHYGPAGDISLLAGDSKWAYAGNVIIKGGDSTNNANEYSSGAAGDVRLTGGDIITPTEGSPILVNPNSRAGSVVIVGGTSNITAGSASAGGNVSLTGGRGGSIGGNGGVVTISGGAGAGTGGDGGSIELKPGTGTGGGVHGEILSFRDFDMQTHSFRNVGTVTYRDENVLTAVGSPPGSSNQISFLNNTFQTLTLTNINFIAFSTFGALDTGIYQLRLVNGGTHPPTGWQAVKWQNNVEPTWTSSASGDIITFFYDGTITQGSPVVVRRNIYYAINVALGFI